MANPEKKSDPLEDIGKALGKMSHLDRLLLQACAGGRILGNPDDPARKDFPGVWAWMSTTAYRDPLGVERIVQPAAIRIQGAQGGFTVSMAHYALGSAVECTTPYLGDFLKNLEEYLTSPKCAIRSVGKKLPKLDKKPKD